MIENIKVDIIYFMTATDFEFEFNLGGCCHMRLLNDKVSDKKAFVNSLARAVSRSQIIIAVGPLFGEDGLITTAAAAISHSLYTVDNKAYGIASQDKIEIIEGAVPLVTKEGYFGGCIVESGNQSIILLTENRTVRKAIMKNLVHPYIEDMCIMQSAAKGGVAVATPSVPQVQGAPAPIEETEPAAVLPAEEEAPETGETAEPEEVLENAVEEQAQEETEEVPEAIEEEAPAEEKPSRQPPENSMEIEFFETEDEQDEDIVVDIEPDTPEMYFVPGEDEPEAETKKGKGLSIAILIICAVLLLVVFAILYFVLFLPLIGGVSTTEYLGEMFNTVSKV